MTLSDEQIQELLRVGNPSAEECRLIRMGWDAALARVRTQGVPDGWKLVPIEPTTEIRKAMHYAYWQSPQLPYHDGSPELWNAAYAAMLEAAPEAK